LNATVSKVIKDTEQAFVWCNK